MARSSVGKYQRLIIRANEYHKQALWQEKLRLLQEALFICEDANFPEADRRKQEILFDVAGIWRRLGQYGRAEKTLQQSLDAYKSPTASFKASVLGRRLNEIKETITKSTTGELGVMARQNNRHHEARDLFREQGRLARDEPPSIESEAEICRAIGNEGISTYNLWQLSNPPDPALLDAAFNQLQERITRAQALQRHISKVDPQSKYLAMAHAWEIIAMDRLTLCYIAAGETEAAVQLAEKSQRKQSRQDPTVSAFSKFYYGNALWHNGQAEKALEQWNTPSGTCSAPMAL
jgi:tetratricopeptide (TPR) repeat protein